MRRIFALLMFLILASAPILDGGCFTSQLVTSSRKEHWKHWEAPCAAYVGGDGSLALVLPDDADRAEARFAVVRFTAEEVAKVRRMVRGYQERRVLSGWKEGHYVTRRIPAGELDPNQGDVAWRAPDPAGPWLPPSSDDDLLRQTRSGEDPAALVLDFSKDKTRLVPLEGATEQEWQKVLPPGGYWLAMQEPWFTPHFSYWPGYSGFVITHKIPPRRLPDRWEIPFAQSGGWFAVCRVERIGGTSVWPTANVLWFPGALILDGLTLPIQIPYWLGELAP